ncbi:uncharacterized protein [Fopius arisanus]|uniref:Uncharacterized protein isoform X2 n=1 Tax=Fopius arisanus TaxID=64838 RepID=A0A9R1TH77_9HYME|nr:PREDICTED: uncharacterized protein LOC105270172 isoform X2 [Fopius arisanus]
MGFGELWQQLSILFKNRYNQRVVRHTLLSGVKRDVTRHTKLFSIRGKMEQERTDCGENFKHLENYLKNNSGIMLEVTQGHSVGCDTLDVILKAEKLVQETKRIISEMRRRVGISQTVSEEVQMQQLSDELLEIKWLVSMKFDEANGRKLRSPVYGTLAQPSSSYPRTLEPWVISKPFPRKYSSTRVLPSSKRAAPLNFQVQRGPHVTIRNDLCLMRMSPLSIHSERIPARANTGTFQLRHEACTKRVRIDEDTSLIDTGVQMGLRDSLPISRLNERDAQSRSEGPDLEQNKTEGSNEVHLAMKHTRGEGQISPSSTTEINTNRRCTFMEFLCRINSLPQNHIEESAHRHFREIIMYEDENWLSSINTMKNSSIISLVHPDTKNVDRLLSRIDRKLKGMMETTEIIEQLSSTNINTTEILDQLYPKAKTESLQQLCNNSNVNFEVVEGVIEKNNYEVEESETQMKPPIFSTPLNNTVSVLNVRSGLDQGARTVSFPALSGTDNVCVHLNDGIVPMTRNPLLYDGEEFRGDKSRIGSGGVSGIDETASLLSNYSSDRSDDPGGSGVKSNRSCRFGIEENEGIGEIEEKMSETVGFTGDKHNERHFEVCVAISGYMRNKENPGDLFSGREETLNDVSRVSSEGLENLERSEKRNEKGTTSGSRGSSRRSSGRCGENIVSFEAKDFSRCGTSHREVTSTPSVSLQSDGVTRGNSAESYSEGELFIMSEGRYSLGEVVTSSLRGSGVARKMCVRLTSRQERSIEAPDQSPGELWDTDIDEISSFESRGHNG